MTTASALEQIGQKLREQYKDVPISSSELKSQAAQLCGHQESSVIPSDFCYNRTNAGIPLVNKPMFVLEGRGLYKFVGTGYPFTGPMVHRPRGQRERIVGNWKNGVFEIAGNGESWEEEVP